MTTWIIIAAVLVMLLVFAVAVIRYQRMMIADLRYQLAEERKWMEPALVKELDYGFQR